MSRSNFHNTRVSLRLLARLRDVDWPSEDDATPANIPTDEEIERYFNAMGAQITNVVRQHNRNQSTNVAPHPKPIQQRAFTPEIQLDPTVVKIQNTPTPENNNDNNNNNANYNVDTNVDDDDQDTETDVETAMSRSYFERTYSTISSYSEFTDDVSTEADFFDMSDLAEELSRIGGPSGAPSGGPIDEDVYRHVAAITIQAIWRGFLARRKFETIRSDARQRVRITQEVYDTEKSYVESLDVVEKIYHRLKGQDIISEKNIKELFGSILEIAKLNRQLLADIKHKMDRANDLYRCNIGQAFVNLEMLTGVYVEYIFKYEKIMDKYRKYIKTSEKFKKFVRSCKEIPETKGLELHSFLIMPIQRIPRYVMLLQDLVKYTPSHHGDYVYLCTALETVKKLASDINEQKREQDRKAETSNVYSKFNSKDADELAAKGDRLFIREGTLLTNEGETKVYMLFDDVIVCAQQTVNAIRKTKLIIKDTIDLKDVTVKDLRSVEGKEKFFEIITPTKTTVLEAPSIRAKDDWCQDIKTAIVNLHYKDKKRRTGRFNKRDGSFGWKHRILQGTLHSACLLGDIDIAALLLGKGDGTELVNKPDDESIYPIHLAAFAGQVKIAKLLLSYQVELDVKDSTSWTALHWAVYGNHLEIVKLLVQAGANIEAKDDASRTPLFTACVYNRVDIFKYLCDQRADVNTTDSAGFSTVHTAAQFGLADIIKIMLQYNVDVNKKNHLGRQALHYATCNGATEIVEMLLQHGASPNTPDDSSQRPIHYTTLSMDDKLLRCLVRNGARLDLSTEKDEKWINSAPSHFRKVYEAAAQYYLKRNDRGWCYTSDPPKPIRTQKYELNRCYLCEARFSDQRNSAISQASITLVSGGSPTLTTSFKASGLALANVLSFGAATTNLLHTNISRFADFSISLITHRDYGSTGTNNCNADGNNSRESIDSLDCAETMQASMTESKTTTVTSTTAPADAAGSPTLTGTETGTKEGEEEEPPSPDPVERCMCSHCEAPVCRRCSTKHVHLKKGQRRRPVCDSCFIFLDRFADVSKRFDTRSRLQSIFTSNNNNINHNYSL